jgi:hypothetical protein
MHDCEKIDAVSEKSRGGEVRSTPRQYQLTMSM